MKRLKQNLPNLLTTLRIISSLVLIVCEPLSILFVSFYVLAGISDMLDGFLARKLDATSPFGEKYDSFADIIFTGICLVKIIPVLQLKAWHMIWIGVIILIKLLNLLCSYLYHRNKLFLHTIANKITGFLLFLSPIVLLWVQIDVILPVLCIVATFAAIQEGHFIRKGTM